jgi:GMP synthase (glutamine-hydrolysing)
MVRTNCRFPFVRRETSSMKRVRVLRHAADEALGNLAVTLPACGVTLDVVDCFAGDWPHVERAGFDPARVAGLVVMGGPMNVDQTDRFPYLATEVQWLRAAVRAELPTLGICLGAQLLAKALGARVSPNRVKEIGWYEIDLEPEALLDGLLAGSRPREIVFQWHGDTFDLPCGAVRLARGKTCENQAFRYGPSAYGVQFHPEMTAEMVDTWLTAPSMCAEVAACKYVDPAEIRRRAPESLARMAPLATRIFERFAGLCGGAAEKGC